MSFKKRTKDLSPLFNMVIACHKNINYKDYETVNLSGEVLKVGRFDSVESKGFDALNDIDQAERYGKLRRWAINQGYTHQEVTEQIAKYRATK